jgi:membrane protease YdiL (CAAX protease family)
MSSMEEDDGTISPFTATLAVVATFLLSLFVGGVLFFLFGYGLALVFGEVLLMIVPLGYMCFRGVNIRSYIGLKVGPRTLLLGVAIGVLLLLSNLFISVALTATLGVSETIEETNSFIIDLSSSPQGLLSVVIALSLAGLCEEFTFRGFLQNAFTRRYSFGLALVVSSLAFGLFHFDPQAIYSLSAFFMGLLLGYIYHHWRSYVVSAVAHSTMNLIALAMMLLIW